jgi:hypothetical protein
MDKEDELEMITTGKPGNVFIPEKESPATASYLSEIFNANFIAHWGNITW